LRIQRRRKKTVAFATASYLRLLQHWNVVIASVLDVSYSGFSVITPVQCVELKFQRQLDNEDYVEP
jgi:hypothetical protein